MCSIEEEKWKRESIKDERGEKREKKGKKWMTYLSLSYVRD